MWDILRTREERLSFVVMTLNAGGSTKGVQLDLEYNSHQDPMIGMVTRYLQAELQPNPQSQDPLKWSP